MNRKNQKKLSSIDKKRKESIVWQGKTDHNLNPSTVSEIRFKKWNDFLLNAVFRKYYSENFSILNIGGGDGNEAEFLLNLGPFSIVVLDISIGQLKSAKLRIFQHNISNIELILGDAEYLGIKNKQFDIGLIFMALHHFPNHEKSLNELSRVCQKIVIIDIMNCGLTKILNLLGLFITEGELIINRIEEKTITRHFYSNNLDYHIQYFFVPPYYGNNSLTTRGVEMIEKTINYWIPRSRHIASFFGNIAIIEGY